MVNTIGPTWDGNEVWLLTAGGATFAAFPGWYASLFSGLYLPLLLVLVGLILRGVAFEYRSKSPSPKWRNMFDWFAIIGSFIPALVLGVGFANFVVGLANDNLLWNGDFFGLFGPFALLGGVLFVVLFMVHGAAFIALKSHGEIQDRAESVVRQLGWVTVVLMGAFVICQQVFYPSVGEFGNLKLLAHPSALVAVVALAASVYLTGHKSKEGWGFVLGGLSIIALITGIFVRMYGNLGFTQSTTVAPNARLNILTAAASPTTLTIMTWAAVVFVPVVLAYQGWSYWVFSKRISVKNIPDGIVY